ncbi:MAG: nitrous oxide reductase accessory protein NosL [Acidimicrobiales bacterium]|jgi:copper chaperone NosL|nr:nitrous oxide reductase accessory protein NosL [Acidimicrobiales bacterium]
MSPLVRTLVLSFALVVGLVAGCGGETASGPPDIVYGRDVCAECGMIISEARYAAAYRQPGEDALAFDDLVDMVTHGTRAGVLSQVDAWVHDYYSEEWINAGVAWYVDADIATPMGGGVVAFSSETDARAFADERGGRVLSWEELVAEVEADLSGATATVGGTEP